MPRRAMLYSRTSYLDKSRVSHEFQLERCREHALQNGDVVVAEFSEDERGVSGADFDAAELNRAVEMARAGKADVLICFDITRFSRDLQKHLEMVRRFREAGAAVEYCTMQFDDSDAGIFLEHVSAAQAEYERRTIEARMKRGKISSMKRGNVIGRTFPYGFRVAVIGGHRTLVPFEQEAQQVRLMYDWYVHGDGDRPRLSLRGIARRLSADRVPSAADRFALWRKKAPRGTWSYQSVAWILKNPVNKGEWTYTLAGHAPVVVPVEPLVSVEMWEAAQRRLGQNRRLARRNVSHDYLLRGRAMCAVCGSSVWGRSRRWENRLYLYYQCGRGNRRDNAEVCTNRWVRADMLDERAWQLIVKAFSDLDELTEAYEHEKAAALHRDGPALRRLEMVEADLEQERARLARLLDLYLDGDFNKDALLDRQTEIERRVAALDAQRAEISGLLARNALVDLAELSDFVEIVRNVIATVTDFNERLWYVDTLDVQAVLHPGQRVEIRVRGVLLGFVDCS